MAHYLKHVQCYFHTEGLRLQSSHLQNFIQNMFYENKEKEAKNGPLFKTHSMPFSERHSAKVHLLNQQLLLPGERAGEAGPASRRA